MYKLNFIKNKDFLYPLTLCFILSIIIGLNYFSFGNFIYDCGREFIVPKAVGDGFIPIKDIFISYFPLSYQINALLFKIFSASLDTLRIDGIFSSFIISSLIYFISREFINPKKSFFITLVVIFITMFNVSYLSNYILSYSYAFIYGTVALLLSVFFILKFIKENKFLYLSFFFLGLCFALKAEYIFTLIPYLFILIYKECSFKKWISSFIFYILPIFTSFLILFIQGFNFNDLFNYFLFMKSFMGSEILKTYSSNIFYNNPKDWILYNFENFKLFIINFLICLPFIFLSERIKNKFINSIFYLISAILIFAFAVFKGNFSAGLELSFLVFPIIYILFNSIKYKKLDFLLLSLVSISLIARFNFLYTGSYLSYTMPIALLTILLYFSENKILLKFMVIFSIVNILYFSVSQAFFATNKVETKYGKMYLANKNEAKIINKTLNFIENKTAKEDEILILPEGAMFNFLTKRKTNLKYYQLLPNHIEALNEDKIISSLKVDLPEYIFILNTDYSIYGVKNFCTDFGKKICNFTYKNYSEIKYGTTSDDFKIRIFKRN